ncbi:MAG: GNAT family N-acetyltransferase [Bacilli bacterium]|nr:GNAT family N-acetyltransferase [Bacilli bacterium]MBN2877618.1 GNAT family N-acetyltransferase [Bacilli bacterium]
MKTLETERLILRPFKLSDLDDFFEYCSLETVGPNAGWSVHKNKEESKTIIEGFIKKGDVLALVDRFDNKVIGSVGLHQKPDEFGNMQTEIGYVLSTPYEGRGLMTEAVRRVLEHAFLELDIDLIHVYHFKENKKSRRVIEKCYFTYVGETVYQTVSFGKKESLAYQLKKEEYLKLREELK